MDRAELRRLIQGPIATVKSNRAWRLQLSGAAATWTATNTQPGVAARPNKPTTDLQWSTAVGGPFAGLTSVPVTAVSGAATAGATTNFYYHTLYNWTLDTPGSYALTVVFTIVSP